jgi:hypothetical protein
MTCYSLIPVPDESPTAILAVRTKQRRKKHNTYVLYCVSFLSPQADVRIRTYLVPDVKKIFENSRLFLRANQTFFYVKKRKPPPAVHRPKGAERALIIGTFGKTNRAGGSDFAKQHT